MSTSFFCGEGNGTPLQYSCLGNLMDGGAWWATVLGVANSRTQLSDFTFTFHFPLSCTGEGTGNPLQCSCLENPRDGGAWWAAVYGVAQSRTRPMRLSSSSRSSFFCWLSLAFAFHRYPSSSLMAFVLNSFQLNVVWVFLLLLLLPCLTVLTYFISTTAFCSKR